jgi:carbon-monoxide dehydrogenase small subunit
VYVAEPEPGDVGEDEAASRIAGAAAGAGLEAGRASAGRANLLARDRGVLRFDPARLSEWNLSDGVTIATLPTRGAVAPRQLAATVKVVPYALPRETVERIEADARDRGSLLRLDSLTSHRVALLLSGSASAAERVRRDFEGPLAARVEALGSRIEWIEFVPLEDETGEAALAAAIGRRLADGAGLVLLAGETAIVDRQDIAPRAIERAGGRIEAFGAPVDPGNLLLLAYVGAIPVVGAPGCARSPEVERRRRAPSPPPLRGARPPDGHRRDRRRRPPRRFSRKADAAFSAPLTERRSARGACRERGDILRRAESRCCGTGPGRRRDAMKCPVSVTVNGVRRSDDVEPRLLLVHYLRENLGLTGTNVGCDTSQCGSCTVLLDGRAVKSCTLLAVQADGTKVTTIEGLARNGNLHPLQDAFWEHHGLQCGFCTPGMILTACEILERHPKPTESQIRHGLEGNLCRCTGYQNIVAAVKTAATRMARASS